ncbi:MAG TPA: hypothetical protein VL360_08375 [Gammaproteobacteria bacterium]|jgi:hypothetical protein|nr:hypothetical protein [Gammaproteobacteria bacterium]
MQSAYKFLSDTKNKVTDTVTGLFQKPEVQSQFIQPYTRFSTYTELNVIAGVLELLYTKKESMKASADEKGNESNEYKTWATLDVILSSINNVIIEFNKKPNPPEVLKNMKDIYDLLMLLKPIASITEAQQETLNSVTADKLNAKSAVTSAGFFAVPFVVPALLLGPGIIAAAAGAALFAAAMPIREHLIKKGVIYFDTESKKMMTDLLELIEQESAKLEKYLTENKIDLGNGNLEQLAPARLT